MSEDVQAELDRLKAENERLKGAQSRGMSMKVSEKGALSVYGLGRFPVTLYKEQWTKLLGDGRGHQGVPARQRRQAEDEGVGLTRRAAGTPPPRGRCGRAAGVPRAPAGSRSCPKDPEARPLAQRVGAGLDEDDLAVLRLHQQQVADEQQLAVAVAPALPAPLAGRRVEAGQDAVVEAVDEAVVHDHVRELRLEARALPQRARPRARRRGRRRGTTSRRCRSRPRRARGRGRSATGLATFGCPGGNGCSQSSGARRGVVRGQARRVQRDQLAPSGEGQQRRRRVARPVGARAPDGRAVPRVVRDERVPVGAAHADHDAAALDDAASCSCPTRARPRGSPPARSASTGAVRSASSSAFRMPVAPSV